MSALSSAISSRGRVPAHLRPATGAIGVSQPSTSARKACDATRGDRAGALAGLWVLRRQVGQLDGERAATPGRRAQVDRATEEFGELLHHGEADAGTFGAARLGATGQLLEAGEHPVLVAHGDAEPGVGDGDLEAVGQRPQLQRAPSRAGCT